ncbi:MAG: tetratricopeptide repeat protein [Capsulimonadales bacterium]|nr:tetratricopeptide repeat protein [Capsulimonadales bacterium]
MNRRKFIGPSALLLSFLFLFLFLSALRIALSSKEANQAILMQTREMQRQFVAERVRIAIEAFKRGEQGTAEKAISDAVRIQGGTSNAVVTVAEELLRQDRPDYAAIMLCDEEGRINACQNPELNWNPLLWATLAKARARVGNKEEADQADREARQRAGAILTEMGNTPPVHGDRPTPLQENAVQRFISAGLYYAEVRKDAEQALRALRKAHEIWPDNIVTENAYGYTLVDFARTPEEVEVGLQLTLRAAQAAPLSGEVLDSYGWALFRKNDLVGAQRILRQAVDLEPNIAEIHYHLARVYAATSRWREAEIEYRRAIELRPDFPEAKASHREATAHLKTMPSPTPPVTPAAVPVATPSRVP